MVVTASLNIKPLFFLHNYFVKDESERRAVIVLQTSRNSWSEVTQE